MINIASRYGIVDLINASQNNIVYIDLGKPLKEAIFEQQYKLAAKMIADIIRSSDREMSPQKGYCRECRRSTCSACIHRDSQGYRRDFGGRQNLTQFHTAVPFIGERGTGKTSVMYSVWERLRCYDGTNENAVFYLGSDLKQVHFVTLDMIDAGMLKTTEDVLEIILAQMLGYLEKLRNDNAFLDLYRRIDELHKNLCAVKDDREREEYGLTSLQHVADSRGTVTKFMELVQEFLAAIGQNQFGGEKCYLVVALDDIDMYQGSNGGMQNTQFALMEHIYRHLRIPGLIVLMTFNEHLLKRACNRHFEEIYFGHRVKRDYTATEQQDINELTAQFMSKLFPREKRIYMPNYMLVDTLDRSNLFVRPKLNGCPMPPFSNEDNELPVKEFMLRLIAYKTDVYFDAAGTKKHFFEPRNLRELGELFSFVNSMEDIPVEFDKDPEAVKSRNRQRLLDYLKNQYALRHMNAKEYEEFTDLLRLPLWRQDRTLIDKIRQQRQKIAVRPGEFGYLSGPGEDRWRYSYGELLHNIYFSTRISKEPGGEDPYFRKEFMHCIFGTQSVQMNEAVRSAQLRQDMLKVVGSSIAGRWANKMLPKLFLPDYAEPAGAGSISLPVRDYFNWRIPDEAENAILGLYQAEDKPKEMAAKQRKAIKANAEKSEKEYLSKFVEALVISGMFFTNIPSRGLGIRLDVVADENGKARLCLRSDSLEHICFNAFNFVINLYDSLPEIPNGKSGYLYNMAQKLFRLGRDFVAWMQKDWQKECKDANEIINKLDTEERRNSIMFMSPDARDRDETKLNEAKNKKAHAQLWLMIKERGTFDENRFLDNWNNAVSNVISRYRLSIKGWREKHVNSYWVLPVQNFDMMYNINKRLASVSYHDIADDADASDVFTHYRSLYSSLAEELEKQDNVYYADKEKGFCQAFKSCCFYGAITASTLTASGKQNKDYNPFIEDVLVSIVSSTIRANATRKRVGEIYL